MRVLHRSGLFAMALCSATAIHAQETTSAIRGIVTDGGMAIADADITIVHVPSGTTATSRTDASGTFAATGLRPGGPFTVRVEVAGHAPLEITGISLTAGQPLRLPIELSQPGDGADIVVTGSKRGEATQLSTGPISVFDRTAIAGVASVKRDIRDIAKRDPFATIDPTNNGISIAGANARTNKFSVDGQRFSDTLGLNTGGLPTARGPVPLDAIEQLSVKVAPYDVAEGDFQGGAINVVLRSGGNKFHGDGFFTYTNDGLTGNSTRAIPLALDFSSRSYGGFLSGPVFEDKLFFALAYERLSETTPATFGLAGAPNVVPSLAQSQIDTVSSILSSNYKYDAMGVLGSVRETDEKYTAKIDWNIVDGQRLALTYIHNSNTNVSAGGGSVSVSQPSLALASNATKVPQESDAAIAQLNSDWSDNFHSEIRVNYRSYDAPRLPAGEAGFAQLTTCLDPSSVGNPINCVSGTTGVADNASLVVGTARFNQTNIVRTKNYGADVTLRGEFAAHSVKLNFAYNRNDIVNQFIANSLGTYYFDSIADLRSGRASSLVLAGAVSGNNADAYGNFSYNQITYGLQDSWDVSNRLNVTYGVRADLYDMSDRPADSHFFQARYGFTNTSTFKGKFVPQPRIGATWRASDRLTLRAGGGLFQGGTPDVLIGRSFTDTGVVSNSITIQRLANGSCNVAAALCSAALDGVNGRTFTPAVLDYLRTNTASLANAGTASMAANYRPASTWKTSLSGDYIANLGFLGDGWRIGGDIYYGFVKDAPIYTDLRSVVIGTTPDGRPRYSTATVNSDFRLTNTDRGHSLVTVARIDKRFGKSLGLGASYTFQDITELAPLNGSLASELYSASAAVDPNGSAYGTSQYEIRGSLKFNLDFNHAFFGDNNTRFSLYGERRSGNPYSLTMRDPASVNSRSVVFGTTNTATRALLYVPDLSSATADPLVVYDSSATYDSLHAYAVANGLTKGVIAKNSMRAPTWFKVDLHVDQEMPIPFVPAKFKLFADLENVLNLIDHNWGSYRTVATNSPIVSVACVASGANACAQYRYSAFTAPVETNQARFSVWGLRVGARIDF